MKAEGEDTRTTFILVKAIASTLQDVEKTYSNSDLLP